MGTLTRWRAATAAMVVATTVSSAGCFGYSRSAKGWSYVGDTVLILGGAAAIAADRETAPGSCTGNTCPIYTSPVSGGLVAGATLVAAGVIGMILNATRPTSRSTSR